MMQFPKTLMCGVAAALLGVMTLSGPALAAGAEQKPAASQQQPAKPDGATAATKETDAKKAPIGSPRAYSSPERVEARIADLQTKLKITPEQKPQFDKMAQAMRDNADAIEDILDHRRQNAGKMSAIEDLRSYEALSTKHAEGMRNLVAAFAPLYENMSPDQKKAADTEFTSYRKRVSSVK